MIITGIRHKIQSDIDIRRTTRFNGYLVYYIRVFAILGVITPIAIGADYILKQQTKSEVLNNKFYQMAGGQQIKYNFYSDTHQFSGNVADFYEHINIGDTLTYYYTPIFNTLTDVTYQSGLSMYVCQPTGIYGTMLIVPVLSLICSTILLLRTHKKKYVKYEPIINLGVINAFLCILTLAFSLFHVVV